MLAGAVPPSHMFLACGYDDQGVVVRSAAVESRFIRNGCTLRRHILSLMYARTAISCSLFWRDHAPHTQARRSGARSAASSNFSTSASFRQFLPRSCVDGLSHPQFRATLSISPPGLPFLAPRWSCGIRFWEVAAIRTQAAIFLAMPRCSWIARTSVRISSISIGQWRS